MADDRDRREHVDLRPDRLRQDADRVPVGDRQPREGEGAAAAGRRGGNAGVSLVYVSPLKALSYDVERNLRAPLAGIGADLSIGLRTGDTPQRERQAMLRKPPDILITTPESLYLMLTSQARNILTDVGSLIVDEIHAVAPTKRGAHMALTLERLERHVLTNAEDGAGREQPIQRIGLSATQRPLERIARFLVGPRRECEIVNAGIRKEMDLEIVVPVPDMADPDGPDRRPPLRVRERRTRCGRRRAPGPDRRPGRRSRRLAVAGDLAGDLPGAAEVRPRAHLDDHLRQQPPRRRAARQAPQRDERRRSSMRRTAEAQPSQPAGA